MVSNLGLASRTCGELQLHVVLGLPQQPLRVQCCQRLRGKGEARKGDTLCWYHHGKGNERKPVSRGGTGWCCLRRVSKRRKARRQTGWRGGQAKGSGGKPGRWSGLCVGRSGDSHRVLAAGWRYFLKLIIRSVHLGDTKAEVACW